MTPTQANKLEELATKNPIPDPEKLEKQINCIKRMAGWYADKANPGPEGDLFRKFATALEYAEDTILSNRALVKKLHNINKED